MNETKREMQPDGGFLETASIASNSAEVQRAKDGTYYWTIKIYWHEGQEQEALQRLDMLDQNLRTRYMKENGA